MRRVWFIGAAGLLLTSAILAAAGWLASWSVYLWAITASGGLTMLAVGIAVAARENLNTSWRIRHDVGANEAQLRDLSEASLREATARAALAEHQISMEKSLNALAEHQISMEKSLKSSLADIAGLIEAMRSQLTELRMSNEAGLEEQESVREQQFAALQRHTAELRASIDKGANATSDTVRWATARIEREQLFSYRQTAALTNLLGTLNLDAPLAPMRNTWAIAPDSAAFLIRTIFEERPQTVLDLGSGLSTVLIAQALEQIGSGRLVSVDHDAEYARKTHAMLVAQGLDDKVDLVVAPLVEHSIGGQAWTWYDSSKLAESSTFDFVVVDGPPGTTGPLARYPVVPILIDRLAPGALLFLDDAFRDDEREVLSRWLSDHGGESLPVPELEKGGALMRIRKSTPPTDTESPGPH